MIPSLNAGIVSSYGIEKKIYNSYGSSFNYGFDLLFYDAPGAYLYQETAISYLRIDNKVLVNDSNNFIFLYEDYVENGDYRNDGYGLGPVGSIDSINSYIKDTIKNNDFIFYPQGDRNMVLRTSIGRKMIITIRNLIYKRTSSTDPLEEIDSSWTLYVNFPYFEGNYPVMNEIQDVVDPLFDGIIYGFNYGWI